MNSMVAAYHRTRGSISGESSLEKKLSKKRKSTSGKSEPSSPSDDKSLGEHAKSSIEVGDKRTEMDENIEVTEWDQSLLEPVADSYQKTSCEDFGVSSETKHSLENTGMVIDHESTAEVSVLDESRTSSTEQDQTKQGLFFLPRVSIDVSGLEQDEEEELDVVKVDYNTKRSGHSGEFSSPFSTFVDLNRLYEAMAAEKVAVGQEIINEDLLKQYLKKKEEKLLKISIRQNRWGADHEIRGLLWPLLCKHFHKAHEDELYEDYAVDIFGQGSTDDGFALPSFVDFSHLECFSLSTEGLVQAKKVTCVIEHTNPDITYCPLLFPFVSLLLHYMNPSKCYNCIYSLLRKKEEDFILQTKVSYEAAKYVVRDLAKKYAKSSYSHLMRNSSSSDAVFGSWLWWIVCDLPFPYLVRVFDCFLTEGMKVFYRVLLAILLIYAKYHAKKSSRPVTDVVSHIRQFSRELPVTVDKLLKVAFSIKGLSRKEIKKLLVKHSMYLKSINNTHVHDDQNGTGLRVSMSRSFSGPIILQTLHSSVLSPDMLYSIWTWLPTRYAVCQPLLLYTSEEHGTSLVTLYSRVENYQPTIIVIKNTENEIFGAFCSSYWRERKLSTKNLSYFGTGETFIFTLAPEKKKYDWVGLKEESIPNTANMFQAGDRSVLTIGGGHGEAILLDETLSHCRTEKCDTFGNEPLCVHEDFACNVVEVYGFQ